MTLAVTSLKNYELSVIDDASSDSLTVTLPVFGFKIGSENVFVYGLWVFSVGMWCLTVVSRSKNGCAWEIVFFRSMNSSPFTFSS